VFILNLTFDTLLDVASLSDGTSGTTHKDLADWLLIMQSAVRQNTTIRMTTARSYDRLNRLTATSLTPAAANQLPLSMDRYTNRAVPGYVDVLGIGTAATAVTVNGTGAYRRGEYFHVALAVDNSSAAQYPSMIIQAVAGANSASSTGRVFLARTPETFVHDADGNLTQDGRWAYTWDGESRLMAMEALSTVPSAAKLRVEFEYDWQGRRIGKAVKAWCGTSYTNVYVLKFLYDGWNLVAEVTTNNVLVRSYLWGTDLSGSFQGAGGVGGLLAVNVATNGVHFPAYDGNGNIAGLVSASAGTTTARFEYGPFAEPIRVSGPIARAMPIRFSTKHLDEEIGLYYYGYRYYDPGTGRWLNRDPIEEAGGLNLYGFVENNPVSLIDPLGQEILVIEGRFEVRGGSLPLQSVQSNWGIKHLANQVRRAFQEIVGDCAKLKIEEAGTDRITVPTSSGTKTVERKRYRLTFSDEKASCKCNDCWQVLKNAIQNANSVVQVRYLINKDNAFGETTGPNRNVYINPGVDIDLPEQSPRGGYRDRRVPFPIVLWHEGIGHSY